MNSLNDSSSTPFLSYQDITTTSSSIEPIVLDENESSGFVPTTALTLDVQYRITISCGPQAMWLRLVNQLATYDESLWWLPDHAEWISGDADQSCSHWSRQRCSRPAG